ncbi:MAG: hypothetical protein DRJ01_02945 [Bacteroidetes bacterium]|nr:MAG: hypothetical protein DRJ01_02945 [Bacteroidota bacterium]
MIKNSLHKIGFIIIFVTFCSCWPHNRIVFEDIIIPKSAVNFSEVNSEYDDYNSAFPGNIINDEFQIYFSSNRDNKGESYDIIKYGCNLQFDQGVAEIRFRCQRMEDVNILQNINSPSSNEYGPYFYYPEKLDTVLLFSSDCGGNLDIYFFDYKDKTINTINEINTTDNEAYATIHNTSSSLYFCSDKEGEFNIYRIKNVFLDTSAIEIKYVNELNSEKNDKCPYIKNNVMVFISDRDGGYGGFDLWYSIYKDTAWSKPINFGPQINTQYDEYRPAVVETDSDKYLNNLMIFSSNRPDGKGGFDLYYVGISKHLEDLNK